MNVIRLAELREEPLSVDEVYAAVTDPAAGGIAVFAGAVRDHDHGQSVTELSYSAHPSAADQLREVAEKVAARFDVHAIAAVHRVGDLAIGDLAVVVGVSSAHRGHRVRGLPRADRRPEGDRADLEAPEVRRR